MIHYASVQRKARSTSAGFTLIELLVVIAIIGLLASIILVSLNGARKKSRDARRQADLKQLQTTLELYANDNNGTYPTSAGAAGAAGVDFTSANVAGLAPTFISAIPTDPLSSSGYYKYKTNSATVATSYCIGATLEGTVPSPATTCSTTSLTGQSTTQGAINYQVGF